MKMKADGLAAGAALVAGSAIIWSFGGALAREIAVDDRWTVVFWRASWAALFLIAFMVFRDGVRGTIDLFRKMGWPGIVVGFCFSAGSTCFILALQYTTVANILLIQSSVPLIAALIGWIVFREAVAGPTWIAIAAVIFGVGIMVSDALTGTVSPLGSGLALIIALVIAAATVITRRYSQVRMTPACCLGQFISIAVAATFASGFAVSLHDMGYLFAFGALNLGLGLAFFATGVRLIPATAAALIGTLETVLGPLWVWITHDEVPSSRTLIGGSIVLAALVAHLLWQSLTARRTQASPYPAP